MREVSDRQLWAWIAGKAAADRLAGIPLSRIEQLGERDLVALPGIGPRTARAVHAVAKLARRFAAPPAPQGTPFESSKEVVRHFRWRLAHEERELCYVLALDTRLACSASRSSPPAA